MADLNDQLADQQAKLAELHAAFSAQLDAAAAAHRTECAARDSELRIREKVASDKMKLLIETDEALKERARVIEKKENEHAKKHSAMQSRMRALLAEIDREEAARANPS